MTVKTTILLAWSRCWLTPQLAKYTGAVQRKLDLPDSTTILVNNFGTLGALAGTRATDHKDDLWLVCCLAQLLSFRWWIRAQRCSWSLNWNFWSSDRHSWLGNALSCFCLDVSCCHWSRRCRCRIHHLHSRETFPYRINVRPHRF